MAAHLVFRFGACVIVVALFGPRRYLNQADDAKWKSALACACLFLALSPFGREHQQILQRINTQERSRLEKMPVC